MSYLYTDSSFLESYDSLIESCFDYAWEREDECLFESMILNELSDDLKLRAAHRVANKLYADKNSVYSDLETVKKFKNTGDAGDRLIANIHSGFAQRNLSSYGRALSGKRNRLLNYYLNSDNGTKYRAYGSDREVNDFDKNEIRKLINSQHSRDIQQEYENLRSEIESLNKDNPELKLNKFGKPLHKMPKIKVAGKVNRTKSLPAKLKQKIRVFIKSLKKKYESIKRKINNTPPEQRSLLQKFMHKIIQMIDKVSGWLSKKGE